MRVSVVGTGRVGASLLYHLAENPHVAEVLVTSRRPESVQAAILDTASAIPRVAAKLCEAPLARLAEADLVVLTCGAQIAAGGSARDLYEQNAAITDSVLATPLKPTAVVVALAAPVDDVTVVARRRCGLPARQVLGFGGDLDRNRLEHILRGRGRPDAGARAIVVGEHGANAIPVYDGAEDYAAVAGELRRFLGTIAAAGPLRNLAPGVMLARLCDTIASDSGRVHHVCGHHPDYGVYLTWPYRVGRGGVLGPEPVALDGQARRDLLALVASRASKTGA